MATRLSTTRFESEEVQGEGSFVVLKAIKVSEVRELRNKSKAAKESGEEFDFFEEGLKMLAGRVLDWDWVDDEGNLLEKPSDNPEVVDELTEAEASFIIDLLLGGKEAKN